MQEGYCADGVLILVGVGGNGVAAFVGIAALLAGEAVVGTIPRGLDVGGVENECSPTVVYPQLEGGYFIAVGAEEVVGGLAGGEDIGKIDCILEYGDIDMGGIGTIIAAHSEVQADGVDIVGHIQLENSLADLVGDELVVVPDKPLVGADTALAAAECGEIVLVGGDDGGACGNHGFDVIDNREVDGVVGWTGQMAAVVGDKYTGLTQREEPDNGIVFVAGEAVVGGGGVPAGVGGGGVGLEDIIGWILAEAFHIDAYAEMVDLGHTDNKDGIGHGTAAGNAVGVESRFGDEQIAPKDGVVATEGVALGNQHMVADKKMQQDNGVAAVDRCEMIAVGARLGKGIGADEESVGAIERIVDDKVVGGVDVERDAEE